MRVYMTAADRISQRIKHSRRYIFERKGFENFASYSQVARSLNQLIDKSELMKLGYGLYTKARLNSLTGKLMPMHSGGDRCTYA